MRTTPTVLFVCTGSAGRSQIAQSLFRRMAGDGITVLSGGVDPWIGWLHRQIRDTNLQMRTAPPHVQHDARGQQQAVGMARCGSCIELVAVPASGANAVAALAGRTGERRNRKQKQVAIRL